MGGGGRGADGGRQTRAPDSATRRRRRRRTTRRPRVGRLPIGPAADAALAAAATNGRRSRPGTPRGAKSSTWAPPRAAPSSSGSCPRAPSRSPRSPPSLSGGSAAHEHRTGRTGRRHADQRDRHRRIVDLSMPVHPDMITFPRVSPPALCVCESHEEFAERIGADQYGVDALTAHYLVVQDDHVGTHCDARKHIVPDAGGPETIPLEYCFSRRRAARLHLGREGPRDHGGRDRGRARPDRLRGQAARHRPDPHRRRRLQRRGALQDRPLRDDRRGDALADRARRADDGHRRDHLRPAGVGDVRAQAVLGGPPRHVGRGVLAPREPHEPRPDRPAVRLPARRAADQVGRHDRRRPCAPSRSWRTERCSCSSTTSAAREVDTRRRQGRVAGAHDRARACRSRRASSCPPTRSRRRWPTPSPSIRAVLARGERGEDLAGWPRRRRRSSQAADSGGEFPSEIAEAYARLGDGEVPVAVRSSATAEDSETASFAGQQETYLHVRGVDEIVERIRDCWCSFFTERALFYRNAEGLARPTSAWPSSSSGWSSPTSPACMFTIDPTKGRRDRMVVEAVFGLGEGVVSGQLTPDHYVLARDGRVKRTRLHTQPYAIVHDPAGGDPRGGAAARARRGADARRRAARAPGEGRHRARGAARRPAGHRVGDPGRRALRPAVAPGDHMTVGTQAIRVVNPATEEEVAGYDAHTPEEIEDAIAGAARGAARLARAPLRRARARRPCASPRVLRERADEFARLITARDGQAARRGRGRGREVRLDVRLLRRARRGVPRRRADRDAGARRATSPTSRSASCWRSCRGTSRSGRSSASPRPR